MNGVLLKSVRKSYGELEVIHGIDLEVKPGEFMVFVGPSGCGKSTLLRMIAGLEDISAGEIVIDDTVVNDEPPANRGIAMVFQSYALYPHMTVAENMGFALRMAGMGKAEIHAAVGQVAEILRITNLLDRKPKALSGGQRQRVAIGRSIVRKPKVFLFDEPLSNLDAELRVQMRQELAQLHASLGTTMIYVTHDQVEAMTLGQRIAVFNGGNLEQVGTPLELYNRPAGRFVAGFLGSPNMNFVPVLKPAAQDSSAVVLRSGELVDLHAASQLIQTATVMGIRPEHLSLVSSGGLRGRVEALEHLGDVAIAYCKLLCSDSLVAIKLTVDEGSRIHAGDDVGLAPDPRHVVLFTDHGQSIVFR